MKGSLVSVIVVTKNSEATIEKCLGSIQSQSYNPVELIVVDNFSSDNTPQISQKYTSLFFQKGPERCPQRNFGVKKAKGEYLLFIDSDMEVSAGVIQSCLDGLADSSEFSAVIIPEISFGEGFWSRAKAFERSFYIGDDNAEAPRFFKKGVFESLGGYDEELIAGEDWDLYRRFKVQNYLATRVKEPIYHNEGTLKYWGQLKKKFYYGKHLPLFFSKGNKNAAQKMPFNLSHLLGVSRLVKYPLLTGGMVVLRLGEFCSLGLGFLLTKLHTNK